MVCSLSSLEMTKILNYRRAFDRISFLFPILFDIAWDQEASVRSHFNGRVNCWSICFRRIISEALERDLDSLLSIPNLIAPSSNKVISSWRFHVSWIFSVKSFYNFVNNGVICPFAKDIWVIKAPLKIKIFIWLSINNMILMVETCWRRIGRDRRRTALFMG